MFGGFLVAVVVWLTSLLGETGFGHKKINLTQALHK